MKWVAWVAWVGAVAALGVGGCAEPEPDQGGNKPIDVEGGTNDEPCADQMEFAYFQFARKGDIRIQGGRAPVSTYTLLYTQGWMKLRTFGGPFEKVAKLDGVETYWKEARKRSAQDLYAYIYEKGFFELPGDDLVDWERFQQQGYSTKAVSVTRDDARHIVFLEDVTGSDGKDPRWNTFNDCVNQLLTTYSSIEDVRAQVQKGSFQKALEDYLRGK
jgi:hypothetical protein